MFIIKIREKLH